MPLTGMPSRISLLFLLVGRELWQARSAQGKFQVSLTSPVSCHSVSWDIPQGPKIPKANPQSHVDLTPDVLLMTPRPMARSSLWSAGALL